MNTEETLWERMAELTNKKCIQKCKILGSCCDKFYCEIAENMASVHGVILQKTANEKLPFLDKNNQCVVPPHLRPMCSLHQCDIASIGGDANDPEWTKEYFELREQLDEIGYDEHSGMW